MSTKPTASREIGILVIGFCVLLVFTAGCLMPPDEIGRDILVFKVDAEGTEQWQTVIDTGGDDIARTITQTADGGYLIGGEVWPWRGGRSYGVFKLNSNGTVDWNVIGEGASASVVETAIGTIVAVSGSSTESSRTPLFDLTGNLLKSEVQSAEAGILESVAGTTDGGVVVVGTFGGDLPVLKKDRNLTEEWRKIYRPTTGRASEDIIVQTSDGGYLVGSRISLPDRGGFDVWILRLNATGDLLWDTTLGTPPLYHDVHFMSEGPESKSTVIYSNIMLGPLEEVVLDPGGNVLEKRALNASVPIIKTTGGGYVYAPVTWYCEPRLLIFSDWVGVPHVVKLDPGGLQEWDIELNVTFAIGRAVSVIQTTDGGYALLADRYNIPTEPQ
ncbi:hypothetical protein [Methanoculleus sp.]|uniref:hypothetical protein n=1 Tax=Methanoculleus sp. TaxID=90427 RepID=UPI0025E165C5|nr:hypothetical protein [Methanoculleus sp.]